MPEPYHPGLEGVIATQTAVSNIEEREGSGVSNIAAIGLRILPGMLVSRRPRFCCCMVTCRAIGRSTTSTPDCGLAGRFRNR